MLIGVIIGAVLVLLIGAPIVAAVMRRSNERARLAERHQQDAERMAQLGSMTGGLAHEIKNPLSTIGLNAQLIAEGISQLDTDDPALSRLTRRIDALRREVDRLRDILEDFLKFAGAIHIEPRPVDLNALAEELADFYEPQASSNGICLRLVQSEQPVWANADPQHLKQAVLNLMLNAVQVMSASEKTAANSDSARPELILRTENRAGPDEPTAVLHVIDTGPGIADDVARQIFNPYFSQRSGGAGLGLAITRRIILEHGGRIELHSELGRGSDFSIILPAANDQQ